MSVDTGEKAIEACKASDDVDIIFMDIKLPGMDGYDTTRHIRKFNTHSTIIALSANAFYEDKQKSLRAGCNSFISKPVSKPEIEEAIKKYGKAKHSK